MVGLASRRDSTQAEEEDWAGSPAYAVHTVGGTSSVGRCNVCVTADATHPRRFSSLRPVPRVPRTTRSASLAFAYSMMPTAGDACVAVAFSIAMLAHSPA